MISSSLYTTQRVAVVGAGLAGLAAGLDLSDQGAAVVVVEARDRVGGRVWTARLSNGESAELGAEWVMPADRALTDLCDRLRLRLAEVGVDYRRRTPVGSMSSTPEEQDLLLSAAADARARLTPVEAEAMSAGAFLDSLPATPGARATLRSRLQGTCSVDLDTVPLRALDGEDAFDAPPASYRRVADGNQSIATAIASRLPDVRLAHRAESIVQSRDGVTIRGRSPDGAWSLDAAAVVVAVPARLVGEIEFDPALPADQTSALAALPNGSAAKLAIATAGEPPLVSIQSPDLPFWCWTGNGPDGIPRRCLTSFAGSSQAQQELATESGDPAVWLTRLRTLVPEIQLEGRPLMKSWGDDDLARGSYSAVDRAALGLGGLLERPLGRVAFAGEHTRIPNEHATMNAAVKSGQRAARDVIDTLRSSTGPV